MLFKNVISVLIVFIFSSCSISAQTNEPSSNNSDTRTLNRAIRDNDLKTVKKILDSKIIDANWNEPLDNLTALDATAIYDRRYMAWLLVNDYGADVNKKDGRKGYPIHYGASFDRAWIVKFLIKHGADFNVTDDLENTPANLAALNGNVAVIEVLKEYGADFSIKNMLKITPLQSACIAQKLFEIKDTETRTAAFRMHGWVWLIDKDPAEMITKLSEVIEILQK